MADRHFQSLRSWSSSSTVAWWLIPDQALLRAWARACDRGRLWPHEPAKWRNALGAGQGRGSLRALSFLVSRLDWQPCGQRWWTHLGDLSWPEAVANIQHASFSSVVMRLAGRRSDFRGLKHGIRSWRRQASGATRAKRAPVNVVLGGVWANQCCSEVVARAVLCVAGPQDDQPPDLRMPCRHGGQRCGWPKTGGCPRGAWAGSSPSAAGGPRGAGVPH